MEPMALGSPVGSPVGQNTSIYLPAYLMGDQQAPTTPRSNTLSPNKAGRNVSFGFPQSPGPTSPQDFNRSQIGQKTLFGVYQETQNSSFTGRNPVGTPSHNAAGSSGPPTTGLFDSLRNESNNIQSQSPAMRNLHQGTFGTPNTHYHSGSQSFQQGQMNDSYYSNNNASFNSSARHGFPNSLASPNTYDNSVNHQQIRELDFWITVFGFPPSAITAILQQFSQCGTIMDKMFPAQSGNWVHLKFSSRLECDKALNYNEKIVGNNIMIGVTHCKDLKVVEKENNFESGINGNTVRPKVRPLIQHTPENSVNPSPSAPQKVSGLMNKAMDLFFGW